MKARITIITSGKSPAIPSSCLANRMASSLLRLCHQFDLSLLHQVVASRTFRPYGRETGRACDRNEAACR